MTTGAFVDTGAGRYGYDKMGRKTVEQAKVFELGNWRTVQELWEYNP